MNFINEYALLFAVSLPVATIVGIQVFLMFTGERGTGILPGFNRYPSIAYTRAEKPTLPAETKALFAEAANDEMERQAA